ncbi:MAG: hypothetical protein ACRD1Y_06110 [Terriglobales bacterium]
MTSRTPIWSTGAAVLAGTLLLSEVVLAQQMQGKYPLSTEQVVARMVRTNAARRQALHAYTATRTYTLVYHGLGKKRAAMTVQVRYQQPGPKRFTVVSESGSAMLRRHVLEPLLRAERLDAAVTSSSGSAIVPANYRFQLLSAPSEDGGDCYVLKATPRGGHKRFLFRGTLWLNAKDFGIERIVGELPHSPSFWVKGAKFDYRGQKIGAFWLPATNHTSAHIRFWGSAELEIRYHNFDLTSAGPLSPEKSWQALTGAGPRARKAPLAPSPPRDPIMGGDSR